MTADLPQICSSKEVKKILSRKLLSGVRTTGKVRLPERTPENVKDVSWRAQEGGSKPY
jgi:hypothetical protein